MEDRRGGKKSSSLSSSVSIKKVSFMGSIVWLFYHGGDVGRRGGHTRKKKKRGNEGQNMLSAVEAALGISARCVETSHRGENFLKKRVAFPQRMAENLLRGSSKGYCQSTRRELYKRSSGGTPSPPDSMTGSGFFYSRERGGKGSKGRIAGRQITDTVGVNVHKEETAWGGGA